MCALPVNSCYMFVFISIVCTDFVLVVTVRVVSV